MNKLNKLKVIRYFLDSSYFKLGIISGLCFLVDLSIFYFLILKISIFSANVISSSIAIILDYVIATRKVFEDNYKRKFKVVVFATYLIYSIFLIYLSSYLVEVFYRILGNAIYSKFIVIPITFTLYWLFYKILFNTKKL